ncbi:MAG: LAGLIDADG family homing endonuclease [Candidatus Kerfeldbacteria bacterium]|nr:LAGLIDADG family homing endonuclease [Candidatus Kerfeldbacteria bacterium]
MGENAKRADNQRGSRLLQWVDPSETTRRTPYSVGVARAYLQGAFHDGTWNRANKRTRFAQSNLGWLYILKVLLGDLGYTSWIYREGKARSVYVLETHADCLDLNFNPEELKTGEEKVAYVRGLFDAEGGTPRNPRARFYVQLVQNDRQKLEKIKYLLNQLGIIVGQMHNPSKSVAPGYWRMFIRTRSLTDFVGMIGSWHPRKVKELRVRMKI